MIPKIIWHYWHDPHEKYLKENIIAAACMESWKRLNPGWEIRIVSRDNLQQWFDYKSLHETIVNPSKQHPKLPAESDIIRVGILAEHGGVYADVDVFCNRPLDDWIHDSDFYVPVSSNENHFTNIMKDREGTNLKPGGRKMETWFISSTTGNSIVSEWNRYHHDYWSHGEYFRPFYYWSISCLQDVLVETSPTHYKKMYNMMKFSKNLSISSITQSVRTKEAHDHIPMLDKIADELHKIPFWKLKRDTATKLDNHFPDTCMFMKLCNNHNITL